jgi:hypothetical protein
MLYLLELLVIALLLYVFIAYVVPYFFKEVALSEQIEKKKEDIRFLKTEYELVRMDVRHAQEVAFLAEEIELLTKELEELEKQKERV